MNAANRAALIRKTQRVLKAAFPKIQIPVKDRPLLEHILYACCLENSTPDQASEAFSKLQMLYVDWNEVRVTTNVELTERMSCLTDPAAAAQRLRRTLHNIYETYYAFDVDFLEKENLGKAQKIIKRYNGKAPRGTLDFVISYVTQNGLGGHSIPLNAGALDALLILEIVSRKDRNKKKVPGLERTISKNNGIEFGALLHQLGVELIRDPYGKPVRELLLKINPKCENSLPTEPVVKTEPTAQSENESPKTASRKKPVKHAAKKTKSRRPAKTKKAAKKPAKKTGTRKSK